MGNEDVTPNPSNFSRVMVGFAYLGNVANSKFGSVVEARMQIDELIDYALPSNGKTRMPHNHRSLHLVDGLVVLPLV
jgi:hypothetical protein